MGVIKCDDEIFNLWSARYVRNGISSFAQRMPHLVAPEKGITLFPLGSMPYG
jgi:hypothetical protein